MGSPTTDINAVNSTVAQAVGRITTGLYVLTATREGKDAAMLMSWVVQCAFEPPQVAAAFQIDRPVNKWLTQGCKFVLNVVPEDDKPFLKHFGKGFELGEDPFEGFPVDRDLASAPVLKSALAWIECEVATATQTSTDATDHLLIVSKVIAGAVLADGKPSTHQRKNGLHY